MTTRNRWNEEGLQDLCGHEQKKPCDFGTKKKKNNQILPPFT